MWTHTNLPIHTRVCDVDMKRETEREIHTGKQTPPAFEASTKHTRERYSDSVLREKLCHCLKVASVQTVVSDRSIFSDHK